MARKFLVASPGYDDPAGGLQTLNAGIERAKWGAPDAGIKAFDAAKEWSGPELAPPDPKIYGVRFDGFPSVTKGVRTDDAANFGDVVPALSNGTGSSPFDNIDPWKSMVPEQRLGGTMVPIKRFWYKLEQNGKGVNIQIANYNADGFSVSPTHMDRNDGKGEREVVYVGRYHCAADTYKSTTGVIPAKSATKANMFTSCKNVGENYYMMDFATRQTLWILYLVEMASWNSQADIGYGCGNNKSAQTMGYTDNMQYCTGTTQANRTTKGIGMQWRNIEGLWDNELDWLSGCYNDSNGLNTILDVAKLADNSGGKTVGLPANGFPGELKVSTNADFPSFYPSAADGLPTTGTADNWRFLTNGPCVCCGGWYNQGNSYGMFFIFCYAATYSGVDVGCRLMELP